MHFIVSLTVSESKRLIAKGVVGDDRVSKSMEAGRVVVLPGTTNGCVMEEIIRLHRDLNWGELFGGQFDRRQFVAGRTLPHGYGGPALKNNFPAVLIDHGKVTITSSREGAEQLKPGDVLIKGVNAINYERHQAAVLVGHPTGGNLGDTIGAAVAQRVCYLHPVGLEKQVGADLNEMSERLSSDPSGKGPTLWVVPGPLFTEIEALNVLCGATAFQISSGGVGGAEGAVWLAVSGSEMSLEKARGLIDEVKVEPPFTDVQITSRPS